MNDHPDLITDLSSHPCTQWPTSVFTHVSLMDRQCHVTVHWLDSQQLTTHSSLSGLILFKVISSEPSVKNGFSDMTKEQVGQYLQRKYITNDHQGKALKEGCHERRWARMSASSRETNTKRDLVRVTTKSKSRTQTVINRHVSRTGNESSGWRASQCQRPHQVSKIEA